MDLPRFFYHARHFDLRQFAVESADGPFYFPEVPKFFTERHIAICDYYIADCD
jgi:hypothetical protein